MIERAPHQPAPAAPQPAGPTTTPAPAAPGIRSTSSLLALQRTAGNRTTVAAIAAGPTEPVIRRAWEQDSQTTEKWDAAISGIRWFRHTDHNAKVTYYFEVEDERALPSLAVLGSAGDMAPAAYWKDDWNYGDRLWRDDLADVAPAAGGDVGDIAPADPIADVPVGDVPVLAGPAPADLAPPLAPPPAVVVATPHSHPTVASARAPQYAPRGAYCWPVTMTTTTAALAVRSWIIQHVVATGDGLNADFYEAFEVASGATVSEGDIFQDEPEDTDGSVLVVARMQHISYSGGAPPPGMAVDAVEGSDGTQYVSTNAPPGWAAGGTRHELDFAWDDRREPKVIRFTTVPAGGDPVFKARSQDLETG